MGRSKVARGDALAIAARLKTFALTRYGTWEAFYKALEISRTTADSLEGAVAQCPRSAVPVASRPRGQFELELATTRQRT